jgi:hypothetical protein
MIVFDLQCINGHAFEGWFEDWCAYEDQKKAGAITCPVCSSTSILKIPSTFGIKTSPLSEAPAKSGSQKKLDLAAVGEKIVKFVEKNFDDVGPEFTTEALKMHYGVTEPRNIRGVSTKQEEKTLKDEGIDFIKIPMPVSSGSKTSS